MKIFNKISAPMWFQKWAFITGLVLFALFLFYPLLVPNHCLFTTDDNLGIMPSIKDAIPQGFFGLWGDAFLMGIPGGRVSIEWTPIFLWLMPAWFGFNWIHALDLLLASIFLAMFLRSAGLSWVAVAMGLITAFWVGSNLTLTYAGHLAKFAVVMFAAASLYGIRKTFESDRPWLWSIVTGGFVGFMFLEQQDVALFFGLFLGAYALFRTRLLFQKRTRLKGLLLLIPMGVMALIMSGATLMTSYVQNVSSITAQQEDNSRQKWEFATQWSWPPEESIDFVAPGYMGWRSGEPEGPYWGRMGRSAGWEKTGQGFMNFKLENQYLGAIPIVFAFFAVFTVFLGSKDRVNKLMYSNVREVGRGSFRSFRASVSAEPSDEERFTQRVRPTGPKAENNYPSAGDLGLNDAKAEMYFWFFAAVLALLLSFGKHFPLYELFYQLPIVSNIRNPNKFLQVFQLAIGILAAYGAHLIFNWRNNTYKNNNVNS